MSRLVTLGETAMLTLGSITLMGSLFACAEYTSTNYDRDRWRATYELNGNEYIADYSLTLRDCWRYLELDAHKYTCQYTR